MEIFDNKLYKNILNDKIPDGTALYLKHAKNVTLIGNIFSENKVRGFQV